MRIIVYKMVLGRYEISEIREDMGDEVRIKFEESIDGKIMLGRAVFPLSSGICKIPKSKLPEGDIHPKLYTASGLIPLESFIVNGGSIIRKNPDSDYVRHVAESVDGLTARVSDIEAQLSEIQNKITQQIRF